MADESTNTNPTNSEISEQLPSLPKVPKRPILNRNAKSADTEDNVDAKEAKEAKDNTKVTEDTGFELKFPTVPRGLESTTDTGDVDANSDNESAVINKDSTEATETIETTEKVSESENSANIERDTLQSSLETVSESKVEADAPEVDTPRADTAEEETTKEETVKEEPKSHDVEQTEENDDKTIKDVQEVQNDETTPAKPLSNDTPLAETIKLPSVPSRPVKLTSSSSSSSSLSSSSSRSTSMSELPTLPQVPSHRPKPAAAAASGAANTGVVLPSVPTSRPRKVESITNPTEELSGIGDSVEGSKDCIYEPTKEELATEEPSKEEPAKEEPAAKIKPTVAPRPSKLKEFKPVNDPVPPPKPKSKPPAVASRIGALRASLFNDLNSMMAKGPPPSRGVPSPFTGQTSVPSNASKDDEDGSKDGTTDNITDNTAGATGTDSSVDSRRSRARGPRGRRLPTAAKSEWTVSISEIWHLAPATPQERPNASETNASETGDKCLNDYNDSTGSTEEPTEKPIEGEDTSTTTSEDGIKDYKLSASGSDGAATAKARNPTPINFSKPMVGSPKKENKEVAVPPIVTDLDLNVAVPPKISTAGSTEGPEAASKDPQKANADSDKTLDAPFVSKPVVQLDDLDSDLDLGAVKNQSSRNVLAADIDLGTPISIKKQRQQQQQQQQQQQEQQEQQQEQQQQKQSLPPLELATDYTVPPSATPKNRMVSLELMSDLSLATPVDRQSPAPFSFEQEQGEAHLQGSSQTHSQTKTETEGQEQPRSTADHDARSAAEFTILGDISVQNSPVVDQGLFSPPGPGFHLQ